MDIVTYARAETRSPPPAGEPDRIAWVDTAKGICIILLVMMHSTLGIGAEMGGEGFMHWVVAFAKPFRMPDFFLVSGLFLGRVIDREWRSYADKRVVHFLYFYLLWLVIQSAFKYGQLAGGSPTGFAAHLAWALVEPYATLWFIYILAALTAPEGSAGAGFIVSRNLGLVDILEVTVSALKPDTVHRVLFKGREEPVAVLKTNPKGAGAVSVVGPTREVRPGATSDVGRPTKVLVVEGQNGPAGSAPALVGG